MMAVCATHSGRARRGLRIAAGLGFAVLLTASYAVPRAQAVMRTGVETGTASNPAVLEFLAAGDGSFLAQNRLGETYRLPALSTNEGVARPGSFDPRSAPALELAAARSNKSTSSLAIRPSEVAGRYYILRQGGKDTGCMLTLDEGAKGGSGYKAFLAPACRDQGMVIFDPAGWKIVGDRLVLTARLGHSAHFDRQADGTWTKDPSEGKTLILKKM